MSHKLKFSNPDISATGWSKPLIFQTLIFWSNSIHKDLQTRNKKSEFLAKIQFLLQIFQFSMKDFHNEKRNSNCGVKEVKWLWVTKKKNFSGVFILDEQPTQTSTKKGIYFKILVVWFVNLLFDISSQVYPFPPFHPSI